jgi:hypothetical protein
VVTGREDTGLLPSDEVGAVVATVRRELVGTMVSRRASEPSRRDSTRIA